LEYFWQGFFIFSLAHRVFKGFSLLNNQSGMNGAFFFTDFLLGGTR
jgi:hypothetical protein